MDTDTADAQPGIADIAARLRQLEPLADHAFDAHLPANLQELSARHWTPLEVVVRGMQWLRSAGASTVVDIGSGAGKFCVAGALASECTFLGIERRPRLVLAARDLASTFGVADRVRFMNAAFGDITVPLADAYYFFNPFAENLFGTSDRIDEEVSLTAERFGAEIRNTRMLLMDLPTGALVLTYHGYGGRLPKTFQSVRLDRTFTGELQLWEKKKRSR